MTKKLFFTFALVLAMSLSGFTQNLVFSELYSALPEQPFDLVSADFDNDTITDLVISYKLEYGEPGFVTFHKGNGDGTFQDPITSLTSLPAEAITAADFDNDGELDICFSVYANMHKWMLAAGNGDGTFTEIGLIDGARFTSDLSVADYNNDDLMDIVGGGNSLFAPAINNGSFSFTRQYLNFNDPHNNSQGFDAGDFNGDGFVDVAAVKPTAGEVLIYMNDGFGQFSSYTTYSVSISEIYNRGVQATDMNNDGWPDVVVAIRTISPNNTISVLLNKGDGTFDTPTSYPITFDYPGWIKAADINLDGDQDIAISTPYGVELLLGTGDGSLAKSSAINGPYTSDLELTDFDNNGIIDIA